MSLPNKFDHWLDDALRQYGNTEPRAGLQTRVLSNLRSAQTNKATRATWKWVLAASAAVAVVIASLSFVGGPRQNEKSNTKNGNIEAPALHAPNCAENRSNAAPFLSSQNRPNTAPKAIRPTKRTGENNRPEFAAAPRL